MTTASAKRGGLAYNLNLNKHWFAFGAVDLENDQFQDLDLRFSPAGGVGAHLIKSDRTQFDALLGASMASRPVGLSGTLLPGPPAIVVREPSLDTFTTPEPARYALPDLSTTTPPTLAS